MPNSSILHTVLGYLDNKTLANLRHVSKTWHCCISGDKIIWKRIIAQKVMNESNSDSWKQLLDKIPLDIVKEIGEGVLQIQSDIISINILRNAPSNGKTYFTHVIFYEVIRL